MKTENLNSFEMKLEKNDFSCYYDKNQAMALGINFSNPKEELALLMQINSNHQESDLARQTEGLTLSCQPCLIFLNFGWRSLLSKRSTSGFSSSSSSATTASARGFSTSNNNNKKNRRFLCLK